MPSKLAYLAAACDSHPMMESVLLCFSLVVRGWVGASQFAADQSSLLLVTAL